MALGRVKVWAVLEDLNAADLNAEYNNILNNALSLISPLTGILDAGSFQITNHLLERVSSNPSAATESRIFYNTTRDFVGVDDSAAIRQLMDAHHTAGYLWGLTLSNGTDATNDINIAAGACVDSTNVAAMRRTAVLTKQLDAAWAVGTDAGGLDTGAIANTTYHVHLIQRVDTGVVDALFSASATAPTMPTNYTLRRRIGSIVRTGGTIVGFIQSGDRFDLLVPINSYNTANPGTSAVTVTLTNVPTVAGLEGIVGVRIAGDASGGGNLLITALDTTDTAPSATLSNFSVVDLAQKAGGEFRVRLNASGQFRFRTDYSTASTSHRFNTIGWVDPRGRLA